MKKKKMMMKGDDGIMIMTMSDGIDHKKIFFGFREYNLLFVALANSRLRSATSFCSAVTTSSEPFPLCTTILQII